jgi:phenylacetate-coenzyme A ligase PaaK-like adenylate-forming protein
MIAYAWENVPYYRQLLDRSHTSPAAVRTSADLQQLPPLTKKLIRENFDALTARISVPGTRQASTGGSTGEPLRFLTTSDVKHWHDAAKLRFWRYAGLELGTRHALIWGSTFDLKRLQKPSVRLERFLGRQLLLDAHTLSEERLDTYAARLVRFRPRVIHGYAQTVHAIARHLIARGISVPTVRSVITSAETLYPHHRAVIEKAFDCEVFNRYASRETALEVQECERHEGMHISIDTAILEVVDDEGRQVGEGASGKLLVTDLTNFAMPLIRYQIEDVGVATHEFCSCGRPFPMIKSIEGRVSDQVILGDGRMIHPLFMMYLMYPNPTQDWNEGVEQPVPGIRQYEITQKDYQAFEIRIVLDNGWDGSHLGYLHDNFKRYLGSDTRLAVTIVPDILPGPSGKRRYVKSELRKHGE